MPAAGYEIDFVKVRGIDRRNPLRAARGRRSRRSARSARRGAALRRRGADVVMGGGGFVAGPAGLAAVADADAARPHRGRQPPRPRQPPAGRAGAAGLPRLPDRGARGRALPGHRAAGAGGGARGRPRRGARARFGIAADARCLLVMGGSQGARSINLVRDRGLRRARGPRLPRRPPRRPPRLRRSCSARLAAAPHAERYTLLAYEPDLGDCLAACDLVLGRSGGSIFEVAAAGRPAILVPYPHATADHQSANAAWMARGGRGDRDRRRRAERRRGSRAEVGGAARRRGAAGGDGGRLGARWRSPTPRAGSPTRSWRRRERDERDWSRAARAALHRHRRRRDERPGAGLRRARRDGHRQRPRRLLLYGAAARGRARARGRPRRRQPARRAPRSSSRPRSARTTRSWRWPASAASRSDPPRRAAGRALRREAADRGRRHPRQDDDHGDAGLGAAGDSAPTRPSSSAARCPGSAPDGGAANAGWGEGEWVVAEADESDASFLRLRPEIAVITNIEMDHHSRWGSVAELREAFARFAGRRAARRPGRRRARRARPAPRSPLRRDAPGPAELALAVPGRHNLLNARAALGRGRARRRSTSTRRPRRSGRLPRRPAPARAEGRARRDRDLRRLRPPPDRGARRARGPARARPGAADRRLPAPPLLADQGLRRASSARRWRSPTRSSSSTSTRPARSRSASWPGSAACTSPAPPPTGWAAGRWLGADRWSRRASALDAGASAPGGSWSRSAPATSSSSPRRWSTDGDAMSAAARGRRARLSRWRG